MDLADLTALSPAQGALVLGAYLLGAVPFGLLVVRLFAGVDVRAQGSGNIGATNVVRVGGKRLGAVTLLLDALKGFAPVLAARLLRFPDAAQGLVALAAVLGHVFPVYLRFKGGKGVATGLGVFAALTPVAAALGAVGYVLAFALLRISSVGSLSLLVVTLVASALTAATLWPFVFELLIGALIIARHQENIARLLAGTEKRL